MAAHDYHDGLPGYSRKQILHDGCTECEQRGQRDDHGISSLDPQNFDRAWARAARWHRDLVTDVSDVEAPLLKTLWSVQLQLEPRGVPIGEVPGGF